MTTIIPRGFKPYGSASTPSYLPELGAFCAERGYRVVDSHWVCGDRLANPLHRCTAARGITRSHGHQTIRSTTLSACATTTPIGRC